MTILPIAHGTWSIYILNILNWYLTSQLTVVDLSGSFMYDLQVATSDMDFALIYQAFPKSLPLEQTVCCSILPSNL